MLVDTSILVELLGRPPTDGLVRRIIEAVGDDVLFASPIQFGELADVARSRKQSVPDVVRKAREILEVIPLDPEIAVAASDLKAQARRRRSAKDFSLIDGIVLASARAKGQAVLTLDSEFDGFDDVRVLSRGP